MPLVKRMVLFLIFLCCSLYLLFYTYAFLHPISLDEHRKNITIYDRYGSILYESNFKKNVTWTSFDQFPAFIPAAVIAIEDQRFFLHPGFDGIRIGKAFLKNLMHHSILEGGSSITQQFSKNLFLTNEKTLARKIQEFIFAARIETHYSKETILEGYLNTCYYGHGIYGISNAAQYFFNKSLSELSIAEIAMLVAIPNGPSYFSPYLHKDHALARRNLLLTIFKKQKLISNQQLQQALIEPLHLYNHNKVVVKGNEQYYIDAVLNKLQQLHLTHYKDLQIYTYYDPYAQLQLNQAILKSDCMKSNIQVAGIISKPYTAQIIAMIGGKDYTQSQYNRALYSSRQIASTVKPLLYYCALKSGFTPSTTFISQPTTFHISEKENYQPTNYADLYAYDKISMVSAIALSDNIYAEKTHLFLGSETLCDAINAFGIHQVKPTPSLALGSVNMSLCQLSRIYNTFASEGLYVKPSLIDHITNNNKCVYKRNTKAKRLLGHDETLILNQMLTATYDINAKSYTWPSMYGYAPNVPCAIKSGTSDWDSLVVGYNPEYTLAIWSGFDDNRLLKPKYFHISKQIFKDTFNGLTKHKPKLWYKPTKSIVKKQIDPRNGLPSKNGSWYWYQK